MANAPTTAALVLAIDGEFSVFTASALKTSLLEAIANASTPDITIDLSAVSEIDSAGLQLMVVAKREAASQGKCLHFIGHSDAVVDLIELFDLTGFFGDPVLLRTKH